MVENVEDHTCFIPVANFVSVLCGRNNCGTDYLENLLNCLGMLNLIFGFSV